MAITNAETRNGPGDRLEANIEDALLLVKFSFERATHGHAAGPTELSEQSTHMLAEAIKSLHVSFPTKVISFLSKFNAL